MLRGWVNGVPGKVDRLISPEEYARAKRLMDERKQSRTRRRATTRLLTGLVRCGNCGGVMSYKADSDDLAITGVFNAPSRAAIGAGDQLMWS